MTTFLKPNTVPVGGGGSPQYFGSDSNANGTPCATDFYIGELGGGSLIGAGSQCGTNVSAGAFSISMAKNASNTYGYWFLVGPSFYNGCVGATTSMEATTWGSEQAQKAIQAWKENDYVEGITIFADVEQSTTFWKTISGDIDQALNQSVLEGFLSELSSQGFGLGVYSSPCAWQDIMGSNYTLDNRVVEWTYEYNYGSSPPDCSQIGWSAYAETCGSQDQLAQGFGGLTPTIWQYSQDPDLDAASILPN